MDALQLPIGRKVVKTVAKTVAMWHAYTATQKIHTTRQQQDYTRFRGKVSIHGETG